MVDVACFAQFEPVAEGMQNPEKQNGAFQNRHSGNEREVKNTVLHTVALGSLILLVPCPIQLPKEAEKAL